ncbi:MAG: trypsin-like peptidase domain-containing protein [Planctomycetes bacterium]|nr:trypsin-like peptidase domain-containing protein [Planctomycetota bacterium]MBL7040129.1 trypsin-like peptidase domain-containing protein [Pirellulaceae bacterium]
MRSEVPPGRRDLLKARNVALSRVAATLLVAICSVVAFQWPAAVCADDVPDAVLKAEQHRIAAIDKAMKTAVSVYARGGRGGGSGVVITPDGYALSNFHVAKPAGDYMKCGMADGEVYEAVVVSIDPTGDVALIKLLGRDDFPYTKLADSDQVRVGDWCFAVGNPFLLATDFQPTVTYGLVSGVHRYQYPAGTLLEYADCIQTDASINPGNSGGPLFNADGDLIGINGRGSFEKRGRVNVGVGYAISINQIKNFMGYLRSGRIVDHATLGATVSTDEDGRVIVTNVLESADAYRRGLRYGDEIVSFGGRQVTTVNGFKNVLGIFPKGWRVPLSFRHEGERRDVFVRLTGVHTHDELIEKAAGAKLPTPEPKPLPKPEDDPEPGDDSKPENGKGKPDEKPAERPKFKPIPIPIPNAPKNKKLPIPIPGHGAPTKKPLPDHIKKLIVKRDGYANYYFNQLNQDRVWTGFTKHGDFAGLAESWKFKGSSAGGEVEILLGADEVSGRFPGESAKLDLGEDLGGQLAPTGSGGLLVTLHLWQRLLTVGPKQYGEVYYLGTVPVLDREGLYDVLVATHDVVEARFLFDPESGHLVGIEMFSDSSVDPCEVYLEDYRDVGGRQVPHSFVVRKGENIFAEFKVETVELTAAPKKEA